MDEQMDRQADRPTDLKKYIGLATGPSLSLGTPSKSVCQLLFSPALLILARSQAGVNASMSVYLC